MRKSAIHITSAQIAAAEHAADSRKDAAIGAELRPNTIAVLRGLRNQLTEAELLDLGRSAAALELRPPSFGAEDRADAAAEVVWHILTECNGAPPVRTSDRAKLAHACGLVKNFRRALIARRAAEDRAIAAEKDRRALEQTDLLEAAEDLALEAADLITAAHEAATAAVRRLGLPIGGDSYATAYQWARDRTAAVCAAENGVSLAAWEKRVKRGGESIRRGWPNPSDLIGALLDTPTRSVGADGLISYSREDRSTEAARTSPGWTITRERDQRPREGTNAGEPPARAATAEDARAACLLRHQCPSPGIVEATLAARRRGYYVAAPAIRSNIGGRPRGFLWIEGRETSPAIERARALRAIGREYARQHPRETSVDPAPTAGKWDPIID